MKLINQWPAACDCIVLGIDENGQLAAPAADLSPDLADFLAAAWKAGCVSTKRFDPSLVPLPESAAYESALLVGLGKAGDLSVGDAFQIGATALRALTKKPGKRLAVGLAPLWGDAGQAALVAGALHGTAGQAIRKSQPERFPPETLAFPGLSSAVLEQGRIVGNALNLARDLVNQPANDLFPESFAQWAAKVASEQGLQVEIWDQDRLAAERCQAILAVGQGSANPPRLVKLSHRGGDPQQPPVVFVGKGITFDTGGYSLKPTDSMLDMKCDMAGAATVVGVMQAIAELKLPCNVEGILALAENMIDGNAYRLGDVITTRSGKTVEIHNTDAEGRVVLADALDVALQSKPAAIVDLATLTGACVVALGTEISGLMGNDRALQAEIQAAADSQGEWVWPLPMHSFFDDQVKGKIADLKNVGDGRWGGATTAAKFLEAFVGQVPWLHIDIAGPAFASNATSQRDAGGTGAMVRTLTHWLQSRVMPSRPNVVDPPS